MKGAEEYHPKAINMDFYDLEIITVNGLAKTEHYELQIIWDSS